MAQSEKSIRDTPHKAEACTVTRHWAAEAAPGSGVIGLRQACLATTIPEIPLSNLGESGQGGQVRACGKPQASTTPGPDLHTISGGLQRPQKPWCGLGCEQPGQSFPAPPAFTAPKGEVSLGEPSFKCRYSGRGPRTSRCESCPRTASAWKTLWGGGEDPRPERLPGRAHYFSRKWEGQVLGQEC